MTSLLAKLLAQPPGLDWPGPDSIPWLKDQLARFEYKPSWRMWIEVAYGGPELNLTFSAPDARGSGRDVTVHSRTLLPRSERSPAGFQAQLVTSIRNAEMHEMDEWLKRDGVLLNDPHAPIWTAKL